MSNSQEKKDEGSQVARRQFLSAAGTGLLLLKPETVFGSQANSAVEVGLIGSGQRGRYDSFIMKEHAGAHIVAMHDLFQGQMDIAEKKIGAPVARRYTGLNGFHELLASKVDAVIIASPPYFHPEQAAAAVNAGKHVFLVKPVAVDVPGTHSIASSGKKAEGKLSFLVDFWSEGDPAFQECARRIHRGDIGIPVVAQTYYHAPRLAPKDKPGMPPGEVRIRNWVFDKFISGDILVEQNVHALCDVRLFLGSVPLKAYGTGGRKVRVDVGDCWDHFLVCYSYPGDVKVEFSSSQFTKGFNDICTRIYGSEGTVEAHHYDYGAVSITGDHPWKREEAGDRTGDQSVSANSEEVCREHSLGQVREQRV